MGRYIESVEALVAMFTEPEIRQLSNLGNRSAVSIDEERVKTAINTAEAELNSYIPSDLLSRIIAAPIVPEVLRRKTGDVTRYHLDIANPREDVRLRYEDAIAWAGRLATARGFIHLGLADEEVISPQALAIPSYGKKEGVFTRERLDNTRRFGYGNRW